MTRMWAAAGMLFNLWPTELCAQYPPRKIFITELASEPRIRVPDTFQLGAISPCSAFLACLKINKLRVFNTPGYSDFPRLQNFNYFVINGLRGICGVHVPLASTRVTPRC